MRGGGGGDDDGVAVVRPCTCRAHYVAVNHRLTTLRPFRQSACRVAASCTAPSGLANYSPLAVQAFTEQGPWNEIEESKTTKKRT